MKHKLVFISPDNIPTNLEKLETDYLSKGDWLVEAIVAQDVSSSNITARGGFLVWLKQP